MRYLAAIDYEHLDNGMFLTGLARSISRQQGGRPVIIHAGSAYTERIMQTGVMRDEAEIRAQKDLNHRLVALFADEGVSAVGINGYQRKLIRLVEGKFKINESFFNRLPDESMLILSALVWDRKKASPVPVSLPRIAHFIQQKLGIGKLFVFDKADGDFFSKRSNEEVSKKWANLSAHFKDEHLPGEFKDFNKPLYLTTARDFQSFPDLKNIVFID